MIPYYSSAQCVQVQGFGLGIMQYRLGSS